MSAFGQACCKEAEEDNMMAASHRLAGAAAGMILAGILTPPDDLAGRAVILSAAVLGSLIPDIDNPRSSISRKQKGIRAAAGIFQMSVRGIASLLPEKQQRYVKGAAGHRGVSHSLVMAFLCACLVHMGTIVLPGWDSVISLAAWGTGAGVVSHLCLDMFAGGVPLLFPFTMKRVTLARIRTGGLAEWMVRMAALGILTALIGNEIMQWR